MSHATQTQHMFKYAYIIWQNPRAMGKDATWNTYQKSV